MVPPTGDGGSLAPIDRPILEFLQTRLQATRQVSRATVTDTSGHLELHVVFAPSYYPAAVDEANSSWRSSFTASSRIL
jgi:hypothetical protein